MKQKYTDFLTESENSIEYWTETIISDFTSEICRVMEEKNISRTALAEKIGASPAYVTKVLRGNINFTLATMTKLARALGMIVRIHLAPDGVILHWSEERAGSRQIDFDRTISDGAIIRFEPSNNYEPNNLRANNEYIAMDKQARG